jgi:LmbE family N-acetylglucosaminyl deacetylase
MLKSYDHIILAPHWDDEVIGCFEVLLKEENKCVVGFKNYNMPLSTIRLQEADAAAKKLNYDIHVFDDVCDLLKRVFNNTISIKPLATIYFPDLRDNHIHHTLVYSAALIMCEQLVLKKCIYTTRMNTEYTRLCTHPNQKTEILKLYKTQFDLLLSTDKKFSLFEGRIYME